MNNDDFTAINDFFEYLSSLNSSVGTKRRINRHGSKGFKNENINIRKGKITTDLISCRETGKRTGSNKKKARFDNSSRFNPLHFIDDP